MAQNVIAIVCDCDGTLCRDTASTLVAELGLDPKTFWEDVGVLVQDGWDPPLAWLNRLLELGRAGDVELVTRERLRALGKATEFYPGAIDFVGRLRERLKENTEFRNSSIEISWYIVSSGIEEILAATSVGALATGVFGSALQYDAEGNAVTVKRSVTFTEKTKFIFAINKGISGEELRRYPYRVNDAIGRDDRAVPFENMVYMGDGPSDIPCFSLIKAQGGRAIGVIPREEAEFRKPYELAQGDRLTVGPYTGDYRDGTDLFEMLWQITDSMAGSIVEKRAQRIRPAPGY